MELHLGFSLNSGYLFILEAPIIRTTVCLSLYWGPPILKNYYFIKTGFALLGGFTKQWQPETWPKLLNIGSRHMNGCQNYDPLMNTPNIRWHIRIGIQKGTIILATTHMGPVKGYYN